MKRKEDYIQQKVLMFAYMRSYEKAGKNMHSVCSFVAVKHKKNSKSKLS